MKDLFGNRVLVKEVKEKVEEKTEGGIILPKVILEKKESEKHFKTGEILMLGDEVTLNLSIGDVVYYYHAAGLDYEGNRVITEKDIIGKK